MRHPDCVILFTFYWGKASVKSSLVYVEPRVTFLLFQFHHATDAKKAMEQLNGFELAGRPMKVGNVTERTDGGSSSRFDADELDRAGVDLGATGRLQLMFKLAEGTGLQVSSFCASLSTL